MMEPLHRVTTMYRTYCFWHLQNTGDGLQVRQHIMSGVNEETGGDAIKGLTVLGSLVYLQKITRHHPQLPASYQFERQCYLNTTAKVLKQLTHK